MKLQLHPFEQPKTLSQSKSTTAPTIPMFLVSENSGGTVAVEPLGLRTVGGQLVLLVAAAEEPDSYLPVKRWTRGAAMAAVAILATLITLTALALRSPEPPPTRPRAAASATVPTSPPSLGEHLRDARESVYLVGSRSADGTSFEPMGTAWVADNRILATAAHVYAAMRDAESRGETLVARTGLGEGQELRILGGRMHPGYVDWLQMFAEPSEMKGIRGVGRFASAPACDVAVLVVDGDTGPALPYASPENSKSAPLPGSAVGYVGYPMESVMGAPTLQVVMGRVTQTTDFFYRASPERARLIHHDAVSTGGASGSPLIDADGVVIGVLSAGNVVNVELADYEGRGRAPVGINYGQDTALIAELIEGIADIAQSERRQTWANTRADLF